MRSTLRNIAELLFPRVCICCKCRIHSNAFLCFHCLESLPFIYDDLQSDSIVAKRLAEYFSIDVGVSLFVFKRASLLQKLIYEFKYSGNKRLAIELGRLLGIKLKTLGVKIDTIIPVPLHSKKKSIRGYNQSALIADGIAKEISAEVNSTIVFRSRHTDTQTRKDKEERRRNMEEGFGVRQETCNKILKKKILLVDDVLTTGATIASCAKKILELEPSSLNIAVVAITI